MPAGPTVYSTRLVTALSWNSWNASQRNLLPYYDINIRNCARRLNIKAVFSIRIGLNTDPDPAFKFNTDPDQEPAFEVNTDPDPGSFMTNIEPESFFFLQSFQLRLLFRTSNKDSQGQIKGCIPLQKVSKIS